MGISSIPPRRRTGPLGMVPPGLRDRGWEVGLTAWAAVAVLAERTAVGPPLQPLLVMSFVLICPGAAAAHLVGLGDRLTRAVLAVAMSTVAATILSQLLLAVGWWSPAGWLVLLALLTVALVWPARLPFFVELRRQGGPAAQGGPR